MASTYSTNLALELIGTGDQSGTWGTTTNTNLGTLIEQAISGYVTQAITDGADTTITIPNGATGVARNMYIEMTGALTAARNLIVPANKKLYFIYNNTTGGYAVTVKVSGQTGVSVPNGAKIVLVVNGTDVVAATTYLTSLSLGSALSVANGGTGLSSYTTGDIIYASGATTLSKLADVATGNALISGGVGVAPSWGQIGLTTHVTGTLPVANGGTGAATLASNNVLLGNGTSALQVVAPGTSGNVLTSNGTTWTSAAAPAAGASLTSIQTFTSSGTYTKPAGLVRIRVRLVGGGGGGSGREANLQIGGAGGGGGGYSEKLISAASVGATESVTVGTGGSGGSSGGSGGTGNTTSFGSHCSATGGTGGISHGNNVPPGGGDGGSGSSGTINCKGQGGAQLTGADVGYGTGGLGGSSNLGGGGRGADYQRGAAATGGNYGGGGGGGDGVTYTSGAAGADGIVIVEEYT